jgi:hypothetical protein
MAVMMVAALYLASEESARILIAAPANARVQQDRIPSRFRMIERCERYDVSRRIRYKWLARFAEDGRRGLGNRSRRPPRESGMGRVFRGW